MRVLGGGRSGRKGDRRITMKSTGIGALCYGGARGPLIVEEARGKEVRRRPTKVVGKGEDSGERVSA
jgi:hypothetical protein